jgi:hypothetical protein
MPSAVPAHPYLNHNLSPDNNSGDVRAHGAFDKGFDDVEFWIDPGIAHHPAQINEDRVAFQIKQRPTTAS